MQEKNATSIGEPLAIKSQQDFQTVGMIAITGALCLILIVAAMWVPTKLPP
jgi:hypothetical protein